MVRVLPLFALAALSFSPVRGIELDVNSVGKTASPSLQLTSPGSP